MPQQEDDAVYAASRHPHRMQSHQSSAPDGSDCPYSSGRTHSTPQQGDCSRDHEVMVSEQ